MSTTKLDAPVQVICLDAVKRRRRLENLLVTRSRIATQSAEHRSHGLDDSVELYMLQLQIEQTIADEFPVEFEERIGDWAEVEGAAEHHPDARSETCSLCQAVSNATSAEDGPLSAA